MDSRSRTAFLSDYLCCKPIDTLEYVATINHELLNADPSFLEASIKATVKG